MGVKVRKPKRPGQVSSADVPDTGTRRTKDPTKLCGAQLRKRPGRYCRQPLGYKTPHVGSGRCYLHGGLTPIKTGMHSMIKHTRLKDLLTELEKTDQEVMDLEPEVKLMRAMVIDFINRYDDFVDQLETWYNAIDAGRSDQKLPPIPRKFPDLNDASQLIEGTSRIVERIHKITREGSITLDVFRTVMSRMGAVVAGCVADDRMLKKIEDGWQEILVDPKSFVRGNPQHVEPDELEN